jgi:hypothetical protein
MLGRAHVMQHGQPIAGTGLDRDAGDRERFVLPPELDGEQTCITEFIYLAGTITSERGTMFTAPMMQRRLLRSRI